MILKTESYQLPMCVLQENESCQLPMCILQENAAASGARLAGIVAEPLPRWGKLREILVCVGEAKF